MDIPERDLFKGLYSDFFGPDSKIPGSENVSDGSGKPAFGSKKTSSSGTSKTSTSGNTNSGKYIDGKSPAYRNAARDIDAIQRDIDALTRQVNNSYNELFGENPPTGNRSNGNMTGCMNTGNMNGYGLNNGNMSGNGNFGNPGQTASGDPAAQTTDQAAAQAPAEPETDPMEDLESLTGLAEIKSDVKELISFVKMQKLREEKGMKSVPVSLHLVFSGNPGTGKTTVARIIARLYKQIGILSKGQLVECDRSSLVAGYVGQTAIKTQNKIKEAMGGVLFIDEAYTLASGGGQGADFGQEAIDTILKAMEDNRKDFVVIVAGYPDLMKKFVNSNPGLKSRFNKYFYFEDYTAEELITIFDGNLKKYDYKLDDETRKLVDERIHYISEHKDANFANAREIRNFFETIVTNQAGRVGLIESPTDEDITTIHKEDLPPLPKEEPKAKSAEDELIDMLKDLQKTAKAGEVPEVLDSKPTEDTKTDASDDAKTSEQ